MSPAPSLDGEYSERYSSPRAPRCLVFDIDGRAGSLHKETSAYSSVCFTVRSFPINLSVAIGDMHSRETDFRACGG